MKALPVIFAAILSVSCASGPKRPSTHTEAPSLKRAQSGVTDAKDFLSQARSVNDRMDAKIIILRNRRR